MKKYELQELLPAIYDVLASLEWPEPMLGEIRTRNIQAHPQPSQNYRRKLPADVHVEYPRLEGHNWDWDTRVPIDRITVVQYVPDEGETTLFTVKNGIVIPNAEYFDLA